MLGNKVGGVGTILQTGYASVCPYPFRVIYPINQCLYLVGQLDASLVGTNVIRRHDYTCYCIL